MDRRPTIYDVAAEAGVAASTVSRAYSRPGRVHSDTARKVFSAAAKLGYRSARLDARRRVPRTHAIGLVIADVTNPFYGDIIKGAYEATREAGYQLVLSHTNESPEVERQTIENELAQVDGIVIASSRMTDAALRKVARQTAVVLLNRAIPEAYCVLNDSARGIRRAAEHLSALGHEQLLYVAGPENSWADGVRWRALREAAADLGLRVQRLGPNEPTILAGLSAARRVAELDVTGVLAYNDALAIGVLKGLRKLGVEVPADVSVVGFDNVILDELVEPSLTTIAAPLFRMGFLGVQNCIAVAMGARPSGPPLVLPVRLVRRQSTADCAAPTRRTSDATPGATPRSARPPRS
jgi:DNA-binding LacI/PurR family transcriptional regulator